MLSLSLQLANLLPVFIIVLCFNAGNSDALKTPLNDTEKDYKLTTEFVMELTF